MAWLRELPLVLAAILAMQTVVCAFCHHCNMNNGESISIILSPAQVDQVVRAAAQGSAPSFSALISTTLSSGRLEVEPGAAEPSEGVRAEDAVIEQASEDPNHKGYFPTYKDARLSRSLLRGLSVLTCFGPDNRERGIIELADLLGMSPSTTHRYVSTLVELGLLERSTRSRKYRLPQVPQAEGNGAHV
jgi:IclR-like helix-turn-helix domain-containing protein